MELLLILLSGFFLWLWIYDSSRRSIALLQTEAGELLCTAPLKGQELRYALAALVVFPFVMNLWVANRFFTDFQFVQCFNMSIWIFLFLSAFCPPFYYHTAFEVHEKGLVARGLFAPWHEVRSYRVDLQGKYVFQFRDFSKKFSVSSRRKGEILAALRRCLEAREVDEPNERHGSDRSPPRLRRTRFQFDLRSLLLFFIFASTLSSLGGIHYHRWDEQRKTVADLDPFQPKIGWRSSEVSELDFSQSPKKPSDDDLPLLLKFPQLRHLDLTGAPITDAGLAHLAALKNPVFINLTGTRVTANGVKQLEKALPEHSAVIGIPTPSTPPAFPPASPP
jgi:hypothetical protein